MTIVQIENNLKELITLLAISVTVRYLSAISIE